MAFCPSALALSCLLWLLLCTFLNVSTSNAYVVTLGEARSLPLALEDSRRSLAGTVVKTSTVLVGSLAQLVKAINAANPPAKSGKIAIVLTNDIVLTRALPKIGYGAKLSVASSCKTKQGKPRRCVVNGGNKFGGFSSSVVSTDALCEISVLDVTFTRFSGSVFSELPCKIHVERSLFSDSFSFSGGSVVSNTKAFGPGLTGPDVYFTGSAFINLKTTTGGGAIVAGDSRFGLISKYFFYSCQFINNSATDTKYSSGGAVSFSGAGSVLFKNVIFKGNTAGTSGGAILAIGTSISAVSTSFISNTVRAGNGSAISVSSNIYGSADLTLCKASFSLNKANGKVGSEIYAEAFPDRTGVVYKGTLTLCNTIAPHITLPKIWVLLKTCPKVCST